MVVDTLNFAEALLIVQLADVLSRWGAMSCFNRIVSSHVLGVFSDVFCCVLWVVPFFVVHIFLAFLKYRSPIHFLA